MKTEKIQRAELTGLGASKKATETTRKPLAETPKKRASSSAAVNLSGEISPGAVSSASPTKDIYSTESMPQAIAEELWRKDLAEALGGSSSIAEKFLIADPDSRKRAEEAMEAGYGTLERLHHLVERSVPETKVERRATALQHASYMAATLNSALGGQLRSVIATELFDAYFDGTLQDSQSKDSPRDARTVLLDNLRQTAVPPDKAAEFEAWVKTVDKKGRLAADFPNEQGVRNNWGSVLAGRATVEFANRLTGNSSEATQSLLRDTFARSPEELRLLIQNGRGLPAILARFAHLANHSAWRLNTLLAQSPSAPRPAMSTLSELEMSAPSQQQTDEARLLAAAVLASLRASGVRLDALDEDRGQSLGATFEHIAQHGPHDGRGDPTSQAMSVTQKIGESLRQALPLSNIPVIGKVADRVLIETLSAFFSGAHLNAGGLSRERAATFFSHVLEPFGEDFDSVQKSHSFDKTDAAYRALYEQLSGRHSYEALKNTLGSAGAADVASQTHLADLLPLAANALHIDVPQGVTAKTVVEDIEALGATLLKDDDFLKSEGGVPSETLQTLRREATRARSGQDLEHIDMAIAGPNAAWMKLVTIRAVAEKRPERLDNSPPDMRSDVFPDATQFNAPMVRDSLLFAWARERLMAQGKMPAEANRMAFSLVVFTQFKDLLQIRKAAGV